MADRALAEVETVVVVSPLPLPKEKEMKGGKILRTERRSDRYGLAARRRLKRKQRVLVCDLYGAVRDHFRTPAQKQTLLFDCKQDKHSFDNH
jgi:hypothetical protein